MIAFAERLPELGSALRRGYPIHCVWFSRDGACALRSRCNRPCFQVPWPPFGSNFWGIRFLKKNGPGIVHFGRGVWFKFNCSFCIFFEVHDGFWTFGWKWVTFSWISWLAMDRMDFPCKMLLVWSNLEFLSAVFFMESAGAKLPKNTIEGGSGGIAGWRTLRPRGLPARPNSLNLEKWIFEKWWHMLN